jgi:fatty acyl-CoA reductase
LFDLARNVNPKFEDIIVPIEGDILKQKFGLKEVDESTLIENCHVVFNSAASIRFEDPLRLENKHYLVNAYSLQCLFSLDRLAIQANVYSVKTLLTLCRKMKKLQVKLRYFEAIKSSLDTYSF